jgi:hypothetical protein
MTTARRLLRRQRASTSVTHPQRPLALPPVLAARQLVEAVPRGQVAGAELRRVAARQSGVAAAVLQPGRAAVRQPLEGVAGVEQLESQVAAAALLTMQEVGEGEPPLHNTCITQVRVTHSREEKETRRAVTKSKTHTDTQRARAPPHAINSPQQRPTSPPRSQPPRHLSSESSAGCLPCP